MERKINLKTLEPLGKRKPIFAIGDIHACSFEFNKLIELAKKKVPDFQIILLGDLFTKGPDPKGVFEIIKEHSALSVKGNHDLSLQERLAENILLGEPLKNYESHESQTLDLISGLESDILAFLKGLPHIIKTQITPVASEGLKSKTRQDAIIVHAGINPRLKLLQNSEDWLLNVRFVDFSKKKSLTLERAFLNGEGDFESKKSPLRWHDFHKGPELVVFGHDALQSLFRKTLNQTRVPICMGLDTGCVYGRHLTGYFLDYDMILHVKSKRQYFDTSKKRINI